MYKRLTKGLNDKGKLIPSTDDLFNYVKDLEKDWYISPFLYNEEQYNVVEITGSVSGIESVFSDRIWFDFDNKDNLEEAKASAFTLCVRLMDYGIPEESLIITFSGNKGFGVEFVHNWKLNPEEVKNICTSLASDLESFDTSVYNSNRILRVINTKHQKSGLYKVPLTFEDLECLTIEEIQEIAQSPSDVTLDYWPSVLSVSSEFIGLKNKKAKVIQLEDKQFKVSDIDFSKKIKGWPNCKWALLNGYQVQSGNRHEKLMCIISQSKALNNTKEQAYYNAKMADEYGHEYYGGDKCDKKDLWRDVESVYNDNWKGGTYTCKDGKTSWLSGICESLGPYKCKHSDIEHLVDVEKVYGDFFNYAKNIEQNTIKTGIEELDQHVRITVGQMVGILGAPSSGKTAMALELLENTSKAGLLSVFYSLDMASSELFQKIAQRVTGKTDTELFHIFKNDPAKSDEIGVKVAVAYKNVKFCFDTGVSVDKIETTINDFEETSGKKVKLLLLDYNELLSSPYSDMTAASGYNAGAMKKLTNSRGICTISLLQPPKMVGDASDEILSYRNVKGSSLLEQCFSIIIGIYRPGFSAESNSEYDNYMVMNVLKNRLGKLISLSFKWNGLKGKISRNDAQGVAEIKELKEKKRQAKSDNGLNFS